MDKSYADTVRLLLSIAPDVFAGGLFAMKGGTALNLFVHDMPRLSVDIDLVYLNHADSRQVALANIDREMAALRDRLNARNLTVAAVPRTLEGDSTLLINKGAVQVKVEANFVFRGTVLPPVNRALSQKTADAFAAELEVPLLAVDELYGSKFVAAMDRQHPRDLFDVLQMYEAGGISDAAVECFVTYLAGHKRPIHEVLFATAKDVALEYKSAFVGMTAKPVPLDDLLACRERLFKELPARLTENHRHFLVSLAKLEPRWELLQCPHAAELPALRWKIENLAKLKALDKERFELQATELERRFE